MPDLSGDWFTYALLVVVAVTAYSVVRTILQMRAARASEQWPSAEGVVIDSTMEEARGEGGEELYRPKVVYRYVALGREHLGDTLTIGGAGADKWEAVRATLDRYGAGSTVLVRYDPEHPDRAILEKTDTRGLLLVLGVEWLIIVIGVLMLIRTTFF
jgi:hypothetical protein